MKFCGVFVTEEQLLNKPPIFIKLGALRIKLSGIGSSSLSINFLSKDSSLKFNTSESMFSEKLICIRCLFSLRLRIMALSKSSSKGFTRKASAPIPE
jgi:hypothetical protein